MAQFEYQVKAYNGATPESNSAVATDHYIQWLNDYGIMSWELVTVHRQWHTFKRQVSEDNDD